MEDRRRPDRRRVGDVTRVLDTVRPMADRFLVALDLDGVLWLGDQPIPGAADAVERLRRAGLGVVFVSNNAATTRAGYVDKLGRMGIEVDLILFRELIGTVTNAIYVKPTLAYDLTRSITFRAASVISFAHKPAATPGNGDMYGVEFDGDLGYENEGFFAGIAYGVLFPLSAMNHSEDLFGAAADAGTAHTIQTRLMLQF